MKKIICNHTLTLQTHVFATHILSSAPSCVPHLCESFAGYCRHSHRCVLYYIACAEIRLVEEHAKLVFANILAVVNLFRNTVNNVRKMSTSPVRRVTTASGKSKKTVNQNQEKTTNRYALQCYSSDLDIPFPNCSTVATVAQRGWGLKGLRVKGINTLKP